MNIITIQKDFQWENLELLLFPPNFILGWLGTSRLVVLEAAMQFILLLSKVPPKFFAASLGTLEVNTQPET